MSERVSRRLRTKLSPIPLGKNAWMYTSGRFVDLYIQRESGTNAESFVIPNRVLRAMAKYLEGRRA